MTSLNSSPNDPRLEQLRQDFRKKQTRLFMTFAFVEGALLALILLLSYGFDVIPQDLGLILLVGTALVSGLVLAGSLMSMMKNHQRAIRDLTGY